jgi:acetylornithine deacetylase/succinyl-diaminopimelate desuccinylase-like protein
MYGGIAPNAAYEASKLLGKLYDDKHRLTIDGYYEGVAEITEEMLRNNASLPITAADIQATTGIRDVLIHEWYDIATANGLLPTIQISGIQSGYTGEWYRNAIPATCLIKLNFRFAPGQDPEQTIALFTDRVAQHLPHYVQYTIETSDPYGAITIMTDHEAVKRADSLLSDIYGKAAVYRYCGAAIPVTGLFQDVLGAVVIIADLANEDCRMHGVGENFRIGNVMKGLEFSRRFFTMEA